jgi:hypothetical protein
MNATLTRTIQCIGALVVMTAFALPALAAKPGISATLEPSHIAAGEAAQLTVTVIGGAGDEPALPRVDGLEFAPMGQTSEYQSINGATTASSIYTYLVTATRAGKFTIPALKIGRGSSAETTQPLVLRVTGTGSAIAPGGRLQPAPALPAPTVPGADDDQAVSNNGQQAFLRLVTPKRKLHVGELVPVQIKAYFRGGVQAAINGLPALSSDAFTLNSLEDKPVQTQEEIDGQPYAVLTWTTALCAVKAGDYSLSLDLPVLLTVREEASQPRGLFGDASFDDSFFDSFLGNSVEKQVTLTSEPDAQSVLALPGANRPADFSGALGQFTVAAEASPDHVTAGDPITLRLTVTGRGNFDRVSSGLLHNSPDWKSYKPVARFAPADSIGSQGTKTFEQAVVPLQAGHLKIPPLSFSYFDPEAARYVTRTTTPLAIDVAPAANTPASVSAANPSAPAPAGNADRPDFAPNRLEPGQFTSTLRPLFLQPWFLTANVLAWVGLAAVFYSLRRHARRTGDPRIARARQAERAIHDQLAVMDSAMEHAETAAFFAAARRALQQRLAERWGLPPETITLTEINARLNGEADGIRPVFQMADQVAYSHENLPAGDLAGWKRILTEQLKQLETR